MKMNVQKVCCLGVTAIKEWEKNRKIQEEFCTQIALQGLSSLKKQTMNYRQ